MYKTKRLSNVTDNLFLFMLFFFSLVLPSLRTLSPVGYKGLKFKQSYSSGVNTSFTTCIIDPYCYYIYLAWDYITLVKVVIPLLVVTVLKFVIPWICTHLTSTGNQFTVDIYFIYIVNFTKRQYIALTCRSLRYCEG